jgi:hypothetical protein
LLSILYRTVHENGDKSNKIGNTLIFPITTLPARLGGIEIKNDQPSERTARQQWQKSAEHEELSMNEHGFQLDRTYGAVAGYIAKFGREPLRNP